MIVFAIEQPANDNEPVCNAIPFTDLALAMGIEEDDLLQRFAEILCREKRMISLWWSMVSRSYWFCCFIDNASYGGMVHTRCDMSYSWGMGIFNSRRHYVSDRYYSWYWDLVWVLVKLP